MAAPIANDLCILLEAGPGEVCVTLPGGLFICAQADVEWGDIPSIARSLMAQVNTALAPLGPFFTMFDVLIAVFDCIKAVKDAIGPPPQPQKLVECVVNLQQAIDKLLALHPAISIPITVKSLLNVIILFLRGLRQEMEQLINFLLELAESETRSVELGNFELQLAVTCAREQFDAELVNMNESIKPLSRLISIVNLLLELAGLPCIQVPLDPLSDATDAALDVIDAAIAFLEAIRDAIPTLDIVLGAIPKSTDPC